LPFKCNLQRYGEVDPVVFNMLNEDGGGFVDYSSIGGLGEAVHVESS
jgi:hypothetical protein